MELRGALACILVVLLDVIAGILSLQGELAQDKVKYFRSLTFKCKVASNAAFWHGVAAAALLLVAHIIANVSGGCICFASKPHHHQHSSLHKQVAAAFLLLSWVLFIVGLGLLIVGAVSNSKSNEFCSLTKHKLLAIGGLVAFIHAIASVAYCFTSRIVNVEKNHNDMEGST
ncbi:hypothetical protein SUGI_0257950 [Cryptomeria japonica]|uniref:protein VASCULATURE COMPLEXITY AND CONNECTIVITY n=1 Tax=Cryptomeria japonica TaxID=3369 RepID=UPI0024089C5D|nr:protein VASCULATURE COMPLEXITY AND CONNECTIVITY [Cryptomeria japonica]GLJ15682.1 hypothetical protein SUGI_0257950 [Cryptomeria japonica]